MPSTDAGRATASCPLSLAAIGQKLPFTFFVVGASLLAKSFIALFASEERLGVPLAPKKM